MIVVFEDDLLNLTIVTYHKLFRDLPESSLHKFNINSTERSITELTRSYPNETVVIIYSGSIFLNVLGENIRIIAKTPLIDLSEEQIFENWYDYWANSITTLDEEIVKYIYDYYHKIPSMMSRRIVEVLKTAVDRNSFKNLLYNNSCNNLQFQGRQLIEKIQPNIQYDNDTSLQRSINGHDCTILLTNYLESPFQLLDKGFDNISICKINLKQREVIITSISKDSQINIFGITPIHERGIYKTIKISLELFVDYIK